MFDIGWSEMAIILLVALIVIGPKDLPKVARTVGHWVRRGQSLAREFQRSLEDMAREAELDQVKKEIEEVSRTDLGKSIERTVDPKGELARAFDPTAKPEPKPVPPVKTGVNGAAGTEAGSAAPASDDSKRTLSADPS
jgi:sec-independent protein translocase protein TatB